MSKVYSGSLQERSTIVRLKRIQVCVKEKLTPEKLSLQRKFDGNGNFVQRKLD